MWCSCEVYLYMGGTVSGVCGCKKLAMIGASQRGPYLGPPSPFGQLRCQEMMGLLATNSSCSGHRIFSQYLFALPFTFVVYP